MYIHLVVDECLHEVVGTVEKLVVVADEFDESVQMVKFLFFVHGLVNCLLLLSDAKVGIFPFYYTIMCAFSRF